MTAVKRDLMAAAGRFCVSTQEWCHFDPYIEAAYDACRDALAEQGLRHCMKCGSVYAREVPSVYCEKCREEPS